MKKLLSHRYSGLLLPISCLPSQFGIGDLGIQAYQFVDLLSINKQYFWQILPLNPTVTEYGNSPYHSRSAFAFNPLLISPELLYRDGLLQKCDLEEYVLPEKSKIDFPGVYSLKQKILERASTTFLKMSKFQQEFYDFCQKQSFWLDDYILFEWLQEQYTGNKWNRWPAPLRDRNIDVLNELKRNISHKLEKYKIIQFLFFRQWNKFKEYCFRKNIKIIGDMPIYVPYQSVDVWSHYHLFKLDKNKNQLSQAGVPPDYFSSTGQLWGNPVYRWSTHRKEGYSWWKKRIKHNLSMVDWLRIDHFRGLVAYWEIPAKEKTAIKGRWVRGGGNNFFQMLTQEFPDLPFIAEDLGIITKKVIGIINQLGIPGMRVLQFAFGQDFPNSPHLPHNYNRNCVVYTGTHDNNTIKGWWQNELKDDQKILIKQYLGKDINTTNIHWELIRLAQSSIANLAIIPIQDILGLGKEARMNNPATNCGNWQWRLTSKQITKLKDNALPRLKELSQTYGRDTQLPEHSSP